MEEIGAESIISDKYLGMIPAFAEYLRDNSSYVRSSNLSTTNEKNSVCRAREVYSIDRLPAPIIT